MIRALALALTLAAPAAADPLPADVVTALDDARRDCAALDGQFVQGEGGHWLAQADLNHDGRQDWLLDYAGLGCTGGALWTGSSGAILSVFVTGEAGLSRTRLIAKDWRVVEFEGGVEVLLAAHAPNACGGGDGPCFVAYTWAGTEMRARR